MYTYTKNDRTEQLNELCLALSRLIPIAQKYAPGNLQQYESAKAKADFLLKNGFTQEELSTLSREVPDVVDRKPLSWAWLKASRQTMPVKESEPTPCCLAARKQQWPVTPVRKNGPPVLRLANRAEAG